MRDLRRSKYARARKEISLGLAKNSVGTFVSQGAIFFLRFPIGILTARYLGPEGKGLLSLLTVGILVSVAVGNLGLGPASTYFVGKRRRRLPAAVANLLIVTGVVGVVVVGAGWGFLLYGRPDVYAQLPPWIWLAFLILIPIHLLRAFLMQVLAAVLRIKEINVLNMVAIALQLLLFVILVVIMETGIEGAFLAYVMPDACIAAAFLWLVIRYGGRPTKPDWVLLKASLRFGVKSYLANTMRRLNLRLDTFLVVSLAVNGVQATGVYSVAVGLAELILFIPESIRLSLFPMVAARGTAEANRLTTMACRHTLFLSVILAVGLAALGPYAIHFLYGTQFADAVIPLLVLLPGVTMLSQAHIFYADFNGRGKPGLTTISAFVGLILTVILDVALIPVYGILGAAIASTCAYTMQFLVAGWFFVRQTRLDWSEILIFRGSDLRRYSEFSVLAKLR